MDWHLALQILNSGILLFILGGLIQFHKDWSQMRLMVSTLWHEREKRMDADIDAKALERTREFAKGAWAGS